MADRRKRSRTTGVSIIRSAKRPIDKNLKYIKKTGVNATQVSTTLFTATFPCTVVGLRWSMDAYQDAGTGAANILWAVVIVRDGNSANNMGASDAADFYTPEQDVLAFGHGSMDNNVDTQHWEGTTKTMRKFMGGDVLQFITLGANTNTSNVQGIIQFFCKS